MIPEGTREVKAGTGLDIARKGALPQRGISVVFAGGTNWGQDVVGKKTGLAPMRGSFAVSIWPCHVSWQSLVSPCQTPD